MCLRMRARKKPVAQCDGLRGHGDSHHVATRRARRINVLLVFFRAIGERVATARNILAGASHRIAASKCSGACKQKQSDESFHETSPFEEWHRLTRRAGSARILSSDRASRQPIRSDSIVKKPLSAGCRSRCNFRVGVGRCLRQCRPTRSTARSHGCTPE